MKIREFIAQLDTISNEQREEQLYKLVELLSPESVYSLMNFQENWIAEDKTSGIKRSWENFRKSQNDVIKFCMEMEVSKLGKDSRSMRGMPQIDMEAEL